MSPTPSRAAPAADAAHAAHAAHANQAHRGDCFDAAAPAGLLAGATGLVGREVARQWAGPGTLHLLLRRPAAPAGPLQRVHVVDFAALPPLPKAEAALCCIGTTIKQAGSRAAMRAVDFDAVLAYARAARAAGADCFAVVSSLGASARSANFYSRIKGEMEEAVAALGYPSVVIVRPSLLLGDRDALGQAPRAGERLMQAFTAPLRAVIPAAWRPIEASTVARAMLRAVAQAQPGVRVVESAELQQLGAP